jgi:hypothetical protein
MPVKSRAEQYTSRAAIAELGYIKNIGKLRGAARKNLYRIDTNEIEERILQKASVIPHQYEFLTSWDTRYIGISGGYGCLDGDTLIDTYEKGVLVKRKIKDLCSSPFCVRTMAGPAYAFPAYQKGFASLYRVTLENGKQFLATKDHRCLSPNGWLQVDHLVEGLSIAVDDIGGDSCSREKSKDLKEFDHQDFRSCDELLNPLEVFLREQIPQFLSTNTSSDLASERLRLPPSLSPLTEDCVHQAVRLLISSNLEIANNSEQFSPALHSVLPAHEYQSSETDILPLDYSQQGKVLRYQSCRKNLSLVKSCQDLDGKLHTYSQAKCLSIPYHAKAQPLPSLLEEAHPRQTTYQNHLIHEECDLSLWQTNLLPQKSEHRFSPSSEDRESEQHLACPGIEPFPFGIGLQQYTWSKVKTVEFVKKDCYYDFHVPVLNHYIANGIVHHNSGKTWVNVAKQLLFAFRSPGCDHLFFEPSIPLLDDIAIPQFNSLLEEFSIPHIFKRTPRPFYILRLPGGNTRILLRSIENWEKIVGVNAASCVMDEIDTIKRSITAKAIINIQGRARVGTCKQQFAFGSTPEGYNFMYDFFWLKKGPDRKLIYGKSEDNPHVRKDYIADIRAQYPPRVAEAYLTGQFVNFNTITVYSEYDRKKNESNVFRPEREDTILFGADFNVNNSRSVYAVMRHEANGPVLHCFAEEKVKDTYELVKLVERKYPSYLINKRVICYPDATGKREYSSSSESDHDILRKAGIKVVPAGGRNIALSYIIGHTNNYFHRRQIKINESTCRDLVDCCEQWGFNEKTGKPDKGGTIDHSNIGDALKYLAWGALPQSGTSLGQGARWR